MFIDIKLAPHGSTIPRSDWNSTTGSWWGTTSSTLRWSSRSCSSFLCLVSKESKITRVSISTYLDSVTPALNFSRLDAEQGPYHEPRRDAGPRSPRCQM